MIAGKSKLVNALKREPFFRALRCDKLILAGLQTTVDLYLSGSALAEDVGGDGRPDHAAGLVVTPRRGKPVLEHLVGGCAFRKLVDQPLRGIDQRLGGGGDARRCGVAQHTVADGNRRRQHAVVELLAH